jgi:hypothetical protein
MAWRSERPRVAGRRKSLRSGRDRTVAFTTGANGDRRQRFAALLGKGRAKWPFAWFSRKIALKESGQTPSLPYPRAAIFIVSGRRNAT